MNEDGFVPVSVGDRNDLLRIRYFVTFDPGVFTFERCSSRDSSAEVTVNFSGSSSFSVTADGVEGFGGSPAPLMNGNFNCNDPNTTSCFMQCVFRNQAGITPGNYDDVIQWSAEAYTDLDGPPLFSSGSVSFLWRGALVDVGEVSGSPGEVVSVPVTLQTNGVGSFDFSGGITHSFNPTDPGLVEVVQQNGVPDCSVLPGSGCEVFFSETFSTVEATLTDCDFFTIDIPEPVYECRFRISNDAAPGNFVFLENRTSDLGDPLTVRGGGISFVDPPPSWLSNGPGGGDVKALAIHPSDDEIVYAGTSTRGIFKSTDGGATWSETDSSVGDVLSISIDPANPDTVYAGTQGNGLFKSTDAGATWAPRNIGNTTVRSIAVDPTNTAILYAGTPTGVFKSTNQGTTWASSGLTSVNAVIIDPANPQILYAGRSNTGVFSFSGGGVYKSTNAGASWTRVGDTLADTNVTALTIDSTAPQTLYAGTITGALVPTGGTVHKSTDAGATWTASGTLPNTPIAAVALAPGGSLVVYAATDLGVFKTSDGGASWTPENTGLFRLRVRAVAVNPAAAEHVYAGTNGAGVFKSTDGAALWEPGNVGLNATNVLALALSSDAIVYSGTLGAGVAKSEDAGDSWMRASDGLDDTEGFTQFVAALATDPNDSETLYAGTLGGVFKSIDAALSWEPANTGLTANDVRALEIDPFAADVIYAGTNGGGVFKSVNAAGSWAAANTGLTSTAIFAIASTPGTPTTLYAGSANAGVFRTTNGASTWAPMNSGLTHLNVRALAIDPFSPQTIYAGTDGGGVFRSLNAAASWSAASTGLTNNVVRGLVVDSNSIVYAATDGGGVFYSVTGGSWTPLNLGLTTLRINALLVDPVPPQALFAGSNGGAVFRLSPVL